MLEANKKRRELNLAAHEWSVLYKELKPIIKNGLNSIRLLEGCVLIIMEEIENRRKKFK